MRNLILLACLVSVVLVFDSFTHLNFRQARADASVAHSPAPQDSGTTPKSTQTTSGVPPAARKELLAAATAHKVRIKADKIAYVSNQKMTLVRAPIAGIEKYADADFESSAPVVLMIIKSKVKLAVPDGSYVVKVQYPRQGESGEAIFTGRDGKVVARRDLGAPILTLPDSTFSSRVDQEEPVIDNCRDIYTHKFTWAVVTGSYPHFVINYPCRDCACEADRPPPIGAAGTPLSHVGVGIYKGLAAGRYCMSSPTRACHPTP